MNRALTVKSILFILAMGVSLIANGCGAYFNTFYNARQAFNDAEKTRKSSKLSGGRVNTTQYKVAIDKSLKVIELHPNSGYYDDALYVLGVSYYWSEAYSKAERRLRELLANYGDSKYVKEAQLYLAKSKLQQNDMEEAMELFEQIFRGDYDNSLKAEAAIALGDYHVEKKDYEISRQYFLAIRDSLGSAEEKKWAQQQTADIYFETFKFKDALSAYLQVLGMQPSLAENYHALFRAAQCSYQLQDIRAGHDYLRTLIDDQRYFDSLGTLKLELAYGHQLEDDLPEAERLYEEVASQDPNRFVSGEAYYQLGLIYQFDYDDLEKAKKYYDQTVEKARGNESGQDALQRSSDIGKLDLYKKKVAIDSTASQDKIDEAAYTQYQLAELYWVALNKPDTAMIEMRYVVDSFPTAYDAPAAIIALSQMYLEAESDSVAADSILHSLLEKYPHSDYVGEALSVLGLKGTSADTGYAGIYLERAEAFLVDEKNTDSAQYYYQFIVDHFPDSKHFLTAKFALLWTTDEYEAPGDSSLVFAYQEFVDSFPKSSWASEARVRLASAPKKQARQDGDTSGVADADDTLLAADDSLGTAADSVGQDDTGYVDPLVILYTDPNGETCVDLGPEIRILNQREEFVYPVEAYATNWEGFLYFQLFLDFSGEVSDLILKTHSPNQELDDEAVRAMSSMTFDIQQIPLQFQGKWYVYKFGVRLPEHLR